MIRHKFITFANLVGTLQFMDDTEYDECRGNLILSRGPGLDDILLLETFFSPKERDQLMSKAFALAAIEMENSAASQYPAF